MKNSDAEDRCPTGITGLDKILDGGFPRGKTILVRGDFGVGKTVIGTQFICNGIEKYNEPGVIVLLEQSVDDYKRDLAAFNFDLDVLQEAGKLVLIDESLSRFNLQKKQPAGKVRHLPSPQERFMTTKEIVDYLLDVIKSIGAKRILIDNLPALDNLLRRTKSTRDELLYMNYNLKDRELTSLLISDTLRNRDDDIENYITDGVIVMEYNVAGPDPGRHLYIKKMRGTSHSEEIHTIKFKKGVGVEVLESE
jgi:KaiC/GvpD/RAD55 family RecA-like ATPase